MNLKKFKYDIVIGLEVHVQLATKTKIFCGCPTTFGQSPNSQICPVCTGLPGTLPVLNEDVFKLGVRAVLALGGEVAKRMKFDRKNYFYPDLPKGYQISQFDQPLGKGGGISIVTPDGGKFIQLTRLHLEEDAGKLIHDESGEKSYVDLNRAGVPLAEIVSEPELKTPEEAYEYLTNLKALMKAIGVSEVNMEKGQLRCDANVSLRKSPSDPLGTKVEIKNVNSFRFVKQALEFEISRQGKLLDEGEAIIQETRLWDESSSTTRSMRSKEEAHDYRYFPEPDLVPFEVDESLVKEIQSNMPELPKEKLAKFQEKYRLSDYDSQFVLQDELVLSFFETVAAEYSNYKNVVNWLAGPIAAYMNENRIELAQLRIAPKQLIELLKLVDDKKVSFRVCKEEVFPELVQTGKSPDAIIKEKNLAQISDTGELDGIIDEIIKNNEKSVTDFKSGKKNALMFLVGQVMRVTKGKANPNVVNQMIEAKLIRS